MQAASDECRPQSESGRRRLATVGVAGVALALSAVAGVPAMAGPPGSQSSHSHGNSADHKTASHSSQAQAHSNSGGHGASESGTQTSATGSNSDTSGHNPPGNNGTVFIHDVAGDHSPHNVPHVGCTFYVDFFGFDNGQQVTVSFAGQAPTGKDTALGGTWTGVVSTDDASGAGNDFDLELTFTAAQLGVTSLGPPAHQGYHVKMTVATNEPGGKKSKVFWIAPCTPPAIVGGTTGGATVSGTGAVKTTTPSGTTTVLGEKFTRRGTPASVAGRSTGLPFTGGEFGLLVAAGLALVANGAALTAATRRRRVSVSPR